MYLLFSKGVFPLRAQWNSSDQISAMYEFSKIVFSEHAIQNSPTDRFLGKKAEKFSPVSSALEIGRLFELHCSQWSRQFFPPVFCKSVGIATLILLDNMNEVSHVNALVKLWLGIRLLARRFPCVRGLFRLVQLTAIRKQAELPDEVFELLEQDIDEWDRYGQHHVFDSDYPLYTLATPASRSDGDEHRMNNILGTWTGSLHRGEGEPGSAMEIDHRDPTNT